MNGENDVEQIIKVAPSRSQEAASLDIPRNVTQPEASGLDQKSELSTLERIAIPGLLVGALYSAYATALTGIRYSNEIRNSIFQLGVYPEPAHPLSKSMAQMLFKDDWIPVWCGNCLYSLLIGAVIWWIPQFVMQHRSFDSKMRENISRLRWICLSLPLIGFALNLWGGILDMRNMMNFIGHLAP